MAIQFSSKLLIPIFLIMQVENFDIYKKSVSTEVDQVFKIKLNSCPKKLHFPYFQLDNVFDEGKFLLFNFINWCFWVGDFTGNNLEVIGCNHASCLAIRNFSNRELLEQIREQVEKIKPKKRKLTVHEVPSTEVTHYSINFKNFIQLSINNDGDLIAKTSGTILLSSGVNILSCSHISSDNIIGFSSCYKGLTCAVYKNKIMITSFEVIQLPTDTIIAINKDLEFDNNLCNLQRKEASLDLFQLTASVANYEWYYYPQKREVYLTIKAIMMMCNYYEAENNYITQTSFVFHANNDKHLETCKTLIDFACPSVAPTGEKLKIDFSEAVENKNVNSNIIPQEPTHMDEFLIIITQEGFIPENLLHIAQLFMACKCQIKKYLATTSMNQERFDILFGKDFLSVSPWHKILHYLLSQRTIYLLVTGNLSLLKTQEDKFFKQIIPQNIIKSIKIFEHEQRDEQANRDSGGVQV